VGAFILTGKIERDLEKEYLDFIKEFKKLPKKPPRLILDFLTEKFGTPGGEEKNPDLKIIVFFCKNEELRKVLVDLGNRGANLTTIWNALKTPDIDEYLINGHPVGLQLYEGELSPYWDEVVRNFEAKKREFFKREKVIRNAVKVITSLKPIGLKYSMKDKVPWINDGLLIAQNSLKEVIDDYLDAKAIEDGLIGYPAKWGMPVHKLVRQKFRPLTQRSHKIWNERIITLVDELKRIGYSNRRAYLKTAELLNLAFPNLSKDKDPDLVRQRYTHQTTQK
jgi:hypothetical protein